MLFVAISLALGLEIDCNTLSSRPLLPEEVTFKTQVCDEYFGAYKNVKLKQLRSTSKLVTTGNLGIEVQKPKAGRILIRYRERNKEGRVVEISAFYALTAFDDVWVAKRNIGPNTGLKSRWFKQEEKDIARYLGMHEPEKGALGRKYTERSIRKGQIIFSDMIQNKPFLEANTKVDVILQKKGISITMQGLALENAQNINDLIQVKIKETGKILSGKIDENKIIHCMY